MIPPGGSGKIVAKMKTAGHPGVMTKTVNVVTNDPQRPSLSLSLTADVRTPVLANPPHASLAGAVGETIETTVVLRRDDGEPLEVRPLASPGSPVTVQTVPVKRPDDALPGTRPGDVVVRLQVADTSRALQAQGGTLRFSTNHPRRAEIALPYYVQVMPAVRPVPAQVSLVRAAQDRPATGQVSLVNTANRTFHVLAVELRGDLPGVVAEILSNGEAMTQAVRLQSAGAVAVGVHRGTLVVKTNDPKAPTVEVPVVLNAVPAGQAVAMP